MPETKLDLIRKARRPHGVNTDERRLRHREAQRRCRERKAFAQFCRDAGINPYPQSSMKLWEQPGVFVARRPLAWPDEIKRGKWRKP